MKKYIYPQINLVNFSNVCIRTGEGTPLPTINPSAVPELTTELKAINGKQNTVVKTKNFQEAISFK